MHFFRFPAVVGGGPSGDPIGILAFEAARAMSRLISLHNALSDSAFSNLQSATIQSPAVVHLNSGDTPSPLRLAAAEMLDDLDRAAATISRLAARCSSPWPRGFNQVYSDLKSGSADFDRKLGFHARHVPKKFKKMESLVVSTSNLHVAMETLAEMEASERKLQNWKNYSGPIPSSATAVAPAQNPPGADAFLKKLAAQRKVVKRLKEESLWSERYEKVTELMARVAVTVFARICKVFADFVPELPVVDSDRSGRFRVNPNPQRFRVHPKFMSGPLERSAPKIGNEKMVKFSGPILRTPPQVKESVAWTIKALEPPSNSVGAAGLALRYADVIALVDKMFQSPEFTGEEEREELYQMLPGSIRSAVKTKLRSIQKSGSNQSSDGISVVDHWRVETRKVLEWLAPTADDTIRWFSERSCERQRFDPAPKVLMLQTLQVSDRKKVEAAIVDVLVGLSFAYQGNNGW